MVQVRASPASPEPLVSIDSTPGAQEITHCVHWVHVVGPSMILTGEKQREPQ